MKFNLEDIRVPEGKKLKLRDWPTRVDPLYSSKDDVRAQMGDGVEKLARCQERHYAARANAILLIFQGMDAAGKDSAIEHVMSGVNPQGCVVHSFKEPSTKERSHDFLWRAATHLPERGQIGIFNRSYYEDVLIVRVHPELLTGDHAVRPGKKKDVWKERYESIRNFEQHLHREGTHVLKFFLHLSKEEQRLRFLSRIDDPEKNWKMSPSDIQERKYWADYQKAYGEAIGATSTKDAPWFIIPADDKDNARLMISKILLKKFKDLKLELPITTKERAAELKKLRRELD
ncbi:MAG: hypothetical protein KF767_02975 [Bdellovibrionaceae bacterium]|nr:hypothetical protein [Pseudobdellovibrionaceae bacterium]